MTPVETNMRIHTERHVHAYSCHVTNPEIECLINPEIPGVMVERGRRRQTSRRLRDKVGSK